MICRKGFVGKKNKKKAERKRRKHDRVDRKKLANGKWRK